MNKITFGLVLLLTSLQINDDGTKRRLLYSILIILCSLLLINCHKKHKINEDEWSGKINIYNKMQEAAYAEATGCNTPGGIPFEYEIDISTPGNKQCGYAYDPSKGGPIYDYSNGQMINTNEVNSGTKLICRCPRTNPPLTGETQWYKRNNPTEYKATLFFTHSYQKDMNGNITSVDPFIPTTSGDTYYCLRSVCGTAYKGNAYLIKIK
jgi:hypothetical protein